MLLQDWNYIVREVHRCRRRESGGADGGELQESNGHGATRTQLKAIGQLQLERLRVAPMQKPARRNCFKGGANDRTPAGVLQGS